MIKKSSCVETAPLVSSLIYSSLFNKDIVLTSANSTAVIKPFLSLFSNSSPSWIPNDLFGSCYPIISNQCLCVSSASLSL